MPLDPNVPLSVKPPQPISPVQTIGSIMQLRNMGSEIALRNAQTQQAQQESATLGAQAEQRQRDLQSANKMQDLLKDPDTQKKLGSGDYSPIWNAGITPGVADTVIKNLQGMQTTAQSLRKDKAAFYASGRATLAAGLQGLHPTDDAAAVSQYNGFRQTLAAEHPELAQKLPQLAPGPDFRRQVQDLAASNGIAHAILENQATLEKEQAATEASRASAESSRATAQSSRAMAAKTGAETPGAEAKSAIEVRQAQAMTSMKPEDWDSQVDSAIAPVGQTAALNQRTKALVRSAVSMGLPLTAVQAVIKDASDQIGKTESAVATAKATAPIKISVAAGSANARADAAGLTDDDYARAGEQYSRTGVMPAMGRDSITRGKIVHAGNQWARDNGFQPADIVTMQAAYAGDKASLAKFQTQRDQIVSFEQTAQKNLDLMIRKAQPLVDSGSPLLNQPLRAINRNALGANEQAAFDAARLIANNEVAKVTSGGGLGGVLSDTARHEVEKINPTNATLGQYLAVAKVLKEDMANRHGSMDATLFDIKSRISGQHNVTTRPPLSSFEK